MRRESLQAQERHAHAARDSVEAGQALASLGVFASLWVANPRKGRLWLKTESCLAGEAQTRTTRPNGSSLARSGRAETGFFRGYSKNRDKREKTILRNAENVAKAREPNGVKEK